jgi:hypothetical protein
MTVAQLINKLGDLPLDAKVGIIYDGADRMDLENVWLAQSGRVLLGDREPDDVYHAEDKPTVT